MSKKNFFGFALSCLYNGTWNPKLHPVKDRVVVKSSFLGRYVNSPVLSSAALGVIGGKLKMKNLRKLV